jgi:hypothetical protein
MTKQQMLEVANNAIEEAGREFADGFVNGYLYCYDTNHQRSQPHTCQAVYTFMIDNLFDKQKSRKWIAGFLFGWAAALSENNPDYFFASIVIPESIPATESLPIVTLQEA